MTTLQNIQQKGDELQTLRFELENQEKQVSVLKNRIRQIEEEHLPALMMEEGIEGLTLLDGGRIELKDFVFARIADERTAFQWLRDTQNDGIIKNEIKVMLDRGQDERADRIKEDLAERGVPFSQKQSVHSSTLKSFCTEALANPELRESLPREAFGIHEGRRVVFK